jgi:hypothetical protein
MSMRTLQNRPEKAAPSRQAPAPASMSSPDTAPTGHAFRNIPTFPTQSRNIVQREGEEDLESADVSGVVQDGLAGGGQALDEETKSSMEPHFGVNFDKVRIHTDSRASDSSESMAARAYAVGTDIAFRSGEYNPSNSEGKKLLAHELTHVVQQGGASESE